jgi:hypothetical protein
LACTPVVFRWEWPEDIKQDIKTFSKPLGRLSNSDLEMAGPVILWLLIEGVCVDLREKWVTLFSDNSPTVGWVTQLASKRSVVAERLIQALALRLKSTHTCPLTPLHIEGIHNKIADIPSRSFGSNPTMCNSDADLLTLFNNHFPLPQQKSWTVYHLSYAAVMHVTSILQMKPFALDDWRRLPTRGKCAGEIGAPMSNTWEWIRTYNRCHMQPESDVLQDSQRKHEQGSMDTANRSRVAQSLALSRPLARRSLWPATKTRQKS